MASRAPLPGSPLTGSDLVTTVNARLATLFDASALPLASVGGTANAVTATLDPALTAGLVTGMRFGITWAATNTGSVTLNINGGGAVAVVSVAGLALPAGALESGLRSMLEYVAGSFVMLTPNLAEAGINKYFHELTTTGAGTFTAPTDLPANTSVVVRMWGGGGGGHSSAGGGGGGAFKELHLTLGSLGASVSYNVAAGGAVGAVGGNSTFGAFGTAYGGRQGAASTGGGGGGTSEAGLVGAFNANAFQGGGIGGHGTLGDATNAGGDASGIWGGGGGARGDTGALRNGGRAVFGGGGGGSNTGGTGGSSIFGGAGGNSGSAGAAKGGGGGSNAPGGRGQIDIFIG